MDVLDSSGAESNDNGGLTTAAVLCNSTDSGVNITSVIFSPYYQHSLYVALVYILAYFFIFLLCMVGNILVCLIMLENRRMRTVTNLFILNLAVSDLLVGIFCIPTTLVDNLITGWPFSNTVCKMSGFVQGVSVSASVFTLVAIAVERFRCIVYPLRPKPSIVVAKAAIVLIWVLAVIIMCPAAIALTVEKIPFHYMVYNHDFNHTFPLYTCYENFANPLMRKVYTAVLFSHIYLVPLTVISVMYGSIGIKLCSSVVAHREPRIANATVQGGGRRGGHQMISQKKIRVIKMLILVALLFTLSWLPLWTLMMMTDYGGLDTDRIDILTSYIFPFAHWLAFANSSVNPIIYGYFNENFKRGFQSVCKARTCRSLLRCHLCRSINRCGRRQRPVQEPCGDTNFRVANSHHHQLGMGLRNRVHNDNKLADAAEWSRGSRAGCVVVHPSRSVSDQGLEMRTVNRNSTKGEESRRVSSMAVSLYQAWDN